MNWLRRWLHPETPPPGFRGTYCAPEVGLPDGFVLPSAALVPVHAEGTPVVVPHIDFDEPTGNPLVAVRKGYGLTPLHSQGRKYRRPEGEIVGYEIAGKLHHPADVQIVRALNGDGHA